MDSWQLMIHSAASIIQKNHCTENYFFTAKFEYKLHVPKISTYWLRNYCLVSDSFRYRCLFLSYTVFPPTLAAYLPCLIAIHDPTILNNIIAVVSPILNRELALSIVWILKEWMKTCYSIIFYRQQCYYNVNLVDRALWSYKELHVV